MTHDEQEIEKLKEFKKWIVWFHSLTREEREEYFKNRWKESKK